MTRLTSKAAVEGMNYHERTRSLLLRVGKSKVLVEVTALLRNHHDQDLQGTTGNSTSNANRRSSGIWGSQSLHISIGESFFQPHPRRAARDEQLLSLCSAVADCLPHLETIHVGRALSGFIHSNVGAWCPVEAIQLLLASSSGKLTSLMLRNLQVYSCSEQDASSGATTLLANSLKHHATLERFVWQHCELLPRSRSILDPVLQTLSTIPNLKGLVVQCPPWSPTGTFASPSVLQTLVTPALEELHLDGFHLQEQHVRRLMLTGPTSRALDAVAALQSISLSFQLTVDTMPELGRTLAKMLQTTPSLVTARLRLEWLILDPSTVATRSCRRQRLQALQLFQDTLAQSLLSTNQHQPRLERLDLIYYDSSQRLESFSKGNPPIICPNYFREVLESNFTLKYLRLPYNGEMEPTIDFSLKLNRTGIRQSLLTQDVPPSRQQCVDALMKVRKDNSCSGLRISKEMSLSLSRTALSTTYYLLHETPWLFSQ
ncbi:expressed unknown protein [Seminavis robusta]|uniref:Uncharacterized protein n=1 Tax=Seminavis robusta TaxID=568900 RepID=A0A9N8DN16_9STRA|nr:expressed unknown protein [Seminavis robusta]|eukprot:Sro252_g099500.1 n/a (487) ;mRNA; f:2677-4137